MSTEHEAAWQRADVAEEFLATRQAVLPLIGVQEDLVRLVFERAGRPLASFLDLGSGDGAMTQLMRSVAPQAQAVLAGPLAGLFDERIAAGHARVAHVHERGSDGGGPDAFEDSAEDRPDPLEDQLAWLREAGFEQVEVHFKWAEGAIFGAVKPEGRA